MVYVGETGRRYGIREGEHKKEVDQISTVKFTRARKEEAKSEVNKSALTDRCPVESHHRLGQR